MTSRREAQTDYPKRVNPDMPVWIYNLTLDYERKTTVELTPEN